MKPIFALIMALAVPALSGCAELNSIHRRVGLSEGAVADTGGEVISVDAKQRHLLISPELVASSGVKWRMCAEAAPDVFSAYAASGAADGGSDGKSVSAKFGFSGSETAATIERTQSINLLRETMYRTCERYLSGAINRTMFITQAARDQRSMIAFLAIEQLTRAARPPAIVISGAATSASVKDGEAAAKMVESFRKTAEDAHAAAGAADADLQKKNATAKCLTQDSADTDPDPDKQAALSSAFADCLAARATKAARDAEATQAQERLDQSLKLAADTVSTINAATQGGASSFGAGGGGATLSDTVARTVESIATSANIDEPLMFCIGLLSDLPERRIAAAALPDASAASVALSSSTTETMCADILHRRAMIDNELYAQQRTLVGSFVDTPQTQSLIDYMRSGTSAERKLKLDHIREALRFFKQPAARADAVALVHGEPALQAAVLAYVKAKYPN